MSFFQGSFPVSSFEYLAEVEASHWWFRSRNRLLLWVLNKKVTHFETFFEVGCGTGFVLEGISKAFPSVDLYGADYFEEGLVFARQRVPKAVFRQLDAKLLEDNNLYDAIGAFDAIEHIDHDEVVLKNLARALRSRGSLIITVPQHQWLWSSVDAIAGHVRRYSRQELEEKVQSTGLKVEYVTSFVSLLVPFMWLARLGATENSYDPLREFKIPRWLNKTLEGIMHVEFFLLKLGLSLPVGGSLLLVAKKL